MLKDLKEATSAVNFDEATAVLDRCDLDNVLSRDDGLSLQIRNYAAEIYDYNGQDTRAAEIISGKGKTCYRDLKSFLQSREREELGWLDLEGRRALKQQAIAVLRAGYVSYRANDYQQALDYWATCKDALTRISSPQYPCHGTLGRVCYAIGLAYRQLGHPHYLDGKNSFGEAIHHAGQDITAKTQAGHSVALSEFRIAKCLGLGLGWVLYTEGQLHLARPLIDTARTLLADKPEKLIASYVDVVHACAEMSAHGDDLATIDNALETLSKAYGVFERKSHSGYEVKAANELAHAYLRRARLTDHLDDYEQARRWANKVKEYAVAKKSDRWLCNTSIVLSRIDRCQGHLNEALAQSETAINYSGNVPFTRTDALIARGEAYVALGQESKSSDHFVSAVRDFRDAFELGRDNPKVAAVCHLHLARAYAYLGSFPSAFHHFDCWNAVRDGIENSFTLQLARQVGAEISDLRKDFVVPFASTSMDHKELTKQLHGFLYRWAMANVGSHGTTLDAANLLRISEQTLLNWRDAGGHPKQPKRKRVEAGNQ